MQGVDYDLELRRAPVPAPARPAGALAARRLLRHRRAGDRVRAARPGERRLRRRPRSRRRSRGRGGTAWRGSTLRAWSACAWSRATCARRACRRSTSCWRTTSRTGCSRRATSCAATSAPPAAGSKPDGVFVAQRLRRHRRDASRSSSGGASRPSRRPTAGRCRASATSGSRSRSTRSTTRSAARSTSSSTAAAPMQRAFTYDWRFWTLPEIRELMTEAGFRETRVYVEAWDDETKADPPSARRAVMDQQETGWRWWRGCLTYAMRFDEILGQERAIATLPRHAARGADPERLPVRGAVGRGQDEDRAGPRGRAGLPHRGRRGVRRVPGLRPRRALPAPGRAPAVPGDERRGRSRVDRHRAAGRGRRPAPRLHLREGGLDPHRPDARPAARAGLQALRGTPPRRRAARRRPHARGPVLGDAQDARGARARARCGC